MRICVKLNPFWNVLATINDSLNSYCIYVQNRESGPLKSYCLGNQAAHIYPFYPCVHERKDFHCCSFWEQCLGTYWSVSRIIYFPRNQKLCRSHLHKEEKIWKSWNFGYLCLSWFIERTVPHNQLFLETLLNTASYKWIKVNTVTTDKKTWDLSIFLFTCNLEHLFTGIKCGSKFDSE